MLGPRSYPDYPAPNARVEVMGRGPVAPWSPLAAGLQASTAFFGEVIPGLADVTTNACFDGSGSWRYIQSNQSAAIYQQNATASTGQHAWYNAGVGSAGGVVNLNLLAILNSQGLGIGVQPASWGATAKVVQLGTQGSVGSLTTTDTAITNNAYFDGGAWRYLANGAATNYYQENSTGHVWRYAASGTAGAAVTWATAMSLDLNGNLSLTGAVGAQNLSVSDGTHYTLAVSAWSGYAGNSGVSILGTGGTNILALGTNGAERLYIDNNGFVGLGQTANAWGVTYSVVQYGGNASFAAEKAAGAGKSVLVSQNAYYDGATWHYISADTASNYYQNLGLHVWRTAASGAAGAAITWTEMMRLTPTGLGIGMTPVNNLDVSGTIGATQSIHSGDYVEAWSNFVANAYYNAGWKYRNTIAAFAWSAEYAGANTLSLITAPRGTAGAALSWTNVLTVTTDGRLYGTALHNNANPVTGTTNQYIASGTYVPVGSPGGNCASIAPRTFSWIRVGNVVVVSGTVDLSALLANNVTNATITIPIPTAATSYAASGTGAWAGIIMSARDISAGSVSLSWTPPSTVVYSIPVMFEYPIT